MLDAEQWLSVLLRADELRPPWQRDALCREYPRQWFFPERGEPAVHARTVCHACLVKSECLEFAMHDYDAYRTGIWGGTSPRERRRLRRAE